MRSAGPRLLQNAVLLGTQVASVRKLETRHCAFVTFADRSEAEKAAEGLSGRLFIQVPPAPARSPPCRAGRPLFLGSCAPQRLPGMRDRRSVRQLRDARPALCQTAAQRWVRACFRCPGGGTRPSCLRRCVAGLVESRRAAVGDPAAAVVGAQGQRCRLLWGKPQADHVPAPNTAMMPSQVRLQREAAAPGSAAAPAMGAPPPGSGAPPTAAAPPAAAPGAPPNFFALPPGGMFGAAMGAAALYPSMDPQALGTRGHQFGIKRPGGAQDGAPPALPPLLSTVPSCRLA